MGTNTREQILADPTMMRRRHLSMAIWSFPLLLLVSTAVGIPFLVGHRDAAGHLSMPITASVVTTLLSELGVIVLVLYYTNHLKDWKDFLRLRKLPARGVVFGLVTGIVLFSLLQFLSWLSARAGIQLQSSDTSTSLGTLSQPFEKYFIYLFLVPFVIPFVEELFFRSMLMGTSQNGLRTKRNGTILGTILASALFGMAHAQGFSTPTDLFIVLWTAFIGFINARLLVKYDSVYVSYCVHLAYNGITVIATLIALS